MKIYEFEGFPNPARIRMALAEKGLMDRVEFVSVNVPEGEHKQETYLAKNPSGTVPALELEDGTIIAECTAITEYIDNLENPGSLTGSTPKQRAVVHMMQRRAEAGLLDAVANYFHHATPGLGPDIEKVQIKDWGEHQKSVAIAGMHYFNSILESNKYVAGDDYSMADITVYAGLAFADFAKIDVPDECNALKSWRDQVTAKNAQAA